MRMKLNVDVYAASLYNKKEIKTVRFEIEMVFGWDIFWEFIEILRAMAGFDQLEENLNPQLSKLVWIF
jgi:hypothetical protein